MNLTNPPHTTTPLLTNGAQSINMNIIPRGHMAILKLCAGIRHPATDHTRDQILLQLADSVEKDIGKYFTDNIQQEKREVAIINFSEEQEKLKAKNRLVEMRNALEEAEKAIELADSLMLSKEMKIQKYRGAIDWVADRMEQIVGRKRRINEVDDGAEGVNGRGRLGLCD